MRDQVDSEGASPVQLVVENAWRRRHLVLTVEHSAIASAVVCCGTILMLLLGTDILDWPWLLLLAASGVAVTFVRVRKQAISRYKVAQVVDQRLELTDSLSTAWYLSTAPSAMEHLFSSEQISRAEEIARKIRPAAVFPFVWRRSWALAGVLAALAFGLFTLRYFTTEHLSFRQGLLPIAFLSRADVMERLEQLLGRPGERGQKASAGSKSREEQTADGPRREESSQPDAPAQSEASNQGNAAGAGSQETNAAPQKSGQSEAGEQKPGSSKENGGAQNNKPAGAKETTDPAKGNSASGAQSARKGEQQPAGLMDRMKEAVSDLMAKLQPKGEAPQKPGEKGASAQESKTERDAEANSKSAINQQSKSESQGQSREQSGQGQAQADAAEKPPGAQSRASDESADRRGSSAQSGVGRQDGEKTIKDAEQLRALGKLDEIIGKRSANLTGDITVETHSSNQQLQTQYSGRVASHVDSGGEIDRNEVPMVLQKYVREYMEQVRKQPDRQ